MQRIKPLMYEGKGLIFFFFKELKQINNPCPETGEKNKQKGVNRQLKKDEMQWAKHMGK